MTIKYGLTLPYGDARNTASLARVAEENGWDGVFVGDAIWCQDPLIQLTAAAMTTSRIRLGTMVLAIPIRRPWHIAGETTALDQLSNGRVIMGMATGATWMGWQGFPGEATNTKVRAEMLDEAIDIITLMHQRKQFDYAGKHYQVKLSLVDPMHYPPATVQQPRVPMWIPGVWPRMKSMKRVLKCDGLLPQKMDQDGKFVEVTPADLREMKAYIDANRTLTTPFDYVIEGTAVGLERSEQEAKIGAWIEAGITWWVESMWGKSNEEVEAIALQGPPRVDA